MSSSQDAMVKNRCCLSFYDRLKFFVSITLIFALVSIRAFFQSVAYNNFGQGKNRKLLTVLFLLFLQNISLLISFLFYLFLALYSICTVCKISTAHFVYIFNFLFYFFRCDFCIVIKRTHVYTYFTRNCRRFCCFLQCIT
jgi:hypothetical protein